MKQVAGGVFVLLLAGLAVQAEDKPGEKAPTAKARYDALVKEYQDAQQAFFKALGKAKTPEDQRKLMKEEAPKIEKVLVRLVELAEQNPKDPVAVDALVRVAQDNFAASAGGTSRKKAIGLLARDHAKSEKVGALCQSLRYGYEKENETLLRAVLEKNPSKNVRAEACLALAQNLAQRAEVARQMASDATFRKRAEQALGKETAAGLKKADPAKMEAEGEKLCRQFADKYVGEMKPDRLVQVCQQLRYSSDKGSEALLRAVLKNEKHEVQGVACLTLGQVLKQRADKDAEKDARKAAKLRGEAEKLLERAAEKYADVKSGPGSATVGQSARKELFEIRHLAVGKPAPEVEGVDQDGKKFRLSDYKGKVVLLDFWSQF